jgi:hypothetical protein
MIMEQVGTEKIGGEQAADLAALMGMVAEEKAAPGVPGEVPTAQDDAAAWAMLPATLGALLCNFMPELESAYSKKNCMEWGAAMVPVAAEYGWNAKDVMGPKMALAVASLPFVVPTYFAIRARRAAPSEPVREERPAVQEAPPAASALDGMSAPGVQPLGNGE